MRISIWRSFLSPRSPARKNSLDNITPGPLRSAHNVVRHSKNCCSDPDRSSNDSISQDKRWPRNFMRLLRAFFIAFLTAVVGCVVAFFVGDYLTRLAHVPEMEGQRGMTVVFLCAPLGILAGLVVGIVSTILVRRRGLAGFLVAQGWSLLIVCGLAGLLVGVPYLLSDKPPRLAGKELLLEFELRAPPQFTIPDTPSGDSVRVSLYRGNREETYAFVDCSDVKRAV